MAFSNKKTIFTGLIVLFGVALFLVVPQIWDSETGHAENNDVDIQQVERQSMQHNSQQTASDRFSNIRIDEFDELIAKVDHIVLGTVVEVHDNINTDEYIFKVDKQYKGKTESDAIYVYEAKGTLQLEQEYVLFLNVTDNSYFPGLVHTSLNDAIIMVFDDILIYRTPLLDQNISLVELESILESSPSIDIIATEDITRGLPYVERGDISLEEIAAQADFIAHVVPHSVTLGNKYARHTQFDFIEIFHDESGFEVNSSTGFTMPGAMEIGEDYIIFLNFHDDFGFLTVSVNGSTIKKSDEENWERALELIQIKFF